MNRLTNPLRRFAGMAALALGLAVAGSSTPAAAQDVPKPAAPIYVTSLGQSLDAFQVQLAVKRAGVPYEYDAHVEADGLGDAKSLFLAVGASLKGFGDAGTNITEELARAGHLLDEAEKRGMTVVVLHVGGEERRDDLSNQLIDLVAPRADLLIIRADSDADGKFKGIAEANKIPLQVVESVQDLKGSFETLFAGG